MDFFDRTGKMAIGSRLRLLTENVTNNAAEINKLYSNGLQPKWFPVFYELSDGKGKTITAIAREIGHSHPSVSTIVSEMTKNGIITEKKDEADGRRNLVSLSPQGMAIAQNIQVQYTDVNNAIEELLAQTRHNLWKAIEEWEFLLEQKSLLKRVQDQKKRREEQKVEIIDYRPEYKADFASLNEEWISRYFKIEEADRKALHHPQENIIDKGGYIFMAMYDNKIAGTCALVKIDDTEYDYELAKMAVAPWAQGKSIGYLLGKAALDKAKASGAKGVYLESNTILKPAISLYHKLGFEKIVGHQTPYERCNIQMGLSFKA
ncbi:MarR family transcriptional regulator with acetyltransferase activity [Mucilaginibacter yixingensis]|uniref:MarR family transcriptional regulator with acetyltransferase activity n=1 Tax=Mucilaginibacter yixingensis TaxID=1295612 RepID=A0A2T5JFE9_9SPHI|nr:bifunctional helix-turn-helix transcriptional regulator/GNAT family N-acetyltransferase [Mucilaginibacter yixingensis]PTR01066.1 MarR family transcriptional regulator with acetyltransferase activity [Mucilaginibacter yixingensis]